MAKIPTLYLTSAEVVAALKARQGGKFQQDFAVEIGIAATNLSLVYSGERNPGTEILKYLGMEKQVVYRLKGGKR